MDRRLFLTGLLGLAGAATVAGVTRPAQALAGVPQGNGILDELDSADAAPLGEAEVVDVQYRHDRRHRPPSQHRPPFHLPPPRRRRRRVWRQVCRRYRSHGRWRTRCHRERVWVWI